MPKEQRLYDSQRWRHVAKRHLDANPLCMPCSQSGRDNPGTIVHHRIPHHGDSMLFWAEDNLESICASCHSGTKRIEENQGYSQACDVNGLPLDQGHEWNKWRAIDAQTGKPFNIYKFLEIKEIIKKKKGKSNA